MPAQGGSVRAGSRVEEGPGLPSVLYRHGGFASGDRICGLSEQADGATVFPAMAAASSRPKPDIPQY